jgi:beta-mannosidase
VHVDDPHWRAQEDWFHLPPGEPRLVRLIPLHESPPPPRGQVRALNGERPVHYEVTE